MRAYGKRDLPVSLVANLVTYKKTIDKFGLPVNHRRYVFANGSPKGHLWHLSIAFNDPKMLIKNPLEYFPTHGFRNGYFRARKHCSAHFFQSAIGQTNQGGRSCPKCVKG